MDDNVAIIGEWVPPSPSPRAFFSAMLRDENGSRPISEPPAQNDTQGFLLVPKDKPVMGITDEKNMTSLDHFDELGPFSKLGSDARGGLMERIAARSGFNAPKLNTEGIRPNDVMNPDGRSPFLMLSPGLSPTTLLDSPVFLSNSLAQPSPTTGKFPFVPNGGIGSSRFDPGCPDRSRENNLFENNNSSLFAFKPVAEPRPSSFSSEPRVKPAFPQQSFPRIEVSAQSDTSLQSRNAEQSKFQLQADFSQPLMGKDVGNNNSSGAIPSDQRILDNSVAGAGHSSPFDEPQDEEGGQKDNEDPASGGGGSGTPSEDGYNWRKYGQKQVKGSEYPSSYYKCTNPNCQVKKKVERSHEGHITQIIYKGAHNHPKPPPSCHGATGGPDLPEQVGARGGTDSNQGWGSNMPKTSASEWRQDNFEVTTLHSGVPEFCNANNTCLQAKDEAQFEPRDAVDASSAFSNEECEDDQANGSISLGYDAEEDESESKRRKIEVYPTDISGATRAIREPRVVVQTTSEVDILDDGYRWRKYGQKVVKGNPNPRSYYKCTSAGCTVRKHVERACHDLKSVITTYEGKHNHDVPAARNSSHGNPAPGSTQPVTSSVQARVRQHEPVQAHSCIPRIDGPGALASFGLPGRPQMSPHEFSFALNVPPGPANFKMSELGAVHGNMLMLPIHPLLAAQQQHQVNGMGLMPSKGEPKPEPVSDTGLNLSINSSVYQQLMSTLPLGHQM